MSDSSKGACYVIAPIGEEDSETRKRSDDVRKHIIAPAVQTCGYDYPERSDHDERPGVITSQIIEHLVKDPLVIADLSEHNANVFYELAVRHVTKKAIILIKHVNWEIPFDVQQTRIIPYDHHDLSKAQKAQEKIVAQITAAEANQEDVDNPITQAMVRLELQGSNQPSDAVLREILSRVEAIGAMLSKMNHLSAERAKSLLDLFGTSGFAGKTPAEVQSAGLIQAMIDSRRGGLPAHLQATIDPDPGRTPGWVPPDILEKPPSA